MSSSYRHKASETPGQTPSLVTLLVGELALNLADGKLYSKKANGQLVEFGVSIVPDPLTFFDTMDEFLVSSNETGEVGQLNWSFTNGTLTTPNAVANRPGIIQRTSGATANQVASLYAGAAVANTRVLMSDWTEMWWIFQQIANNADHIQRYGLFADASANPSTDFIGLERLAADTNWFSVTRTGGVQTRKDTGQAYNTNWRKLLVKKNGTSLEFYLDGVLVTTHTNAENIPAGTVGLLPNSQITPTTTTARSFNLDFFRLKGQVNR